MKSSVRRISFYGYLGSGNLGNDASFEVAIDWWRRHHPQIELHCITIAPDAVQERYGIASDALAWRPRRESRGRVLQIAQQLAGRLVDVIRTYRFVGRTDAVIVPGMGVLESTLGTKPWGMPVWLFVMSLACRLRHRPFILLDVGADYAQHRITRWLNQATVALATHVSYRDRESAAAMSAASSGQPDVIAPDLAFAHPAISTIAARPHRIVVGVMAYYGPADDPVSGSEIRATYVSTLAEALTELIADGYDIVVVGGDKADQDVALQVQVEVGELPNVAQKLVVRTCTTFAELTEEMAQASVVVASRYHNVICALHARRAVVSVAYAPKNSHLLQTFGLAAYCQDIVGLDACELTSRVRRAASERDELTNSIDRTASQAAREVRTLLESVADSLVTADIARQMATEGRPEAHA